MKSTKIENYKKDVLDMYESTSGGNMRHYLATPTPKNIRSACEELFYKGVANDDLYILQAFFKFKPKDDFLKVIQNHDIDKFRPIQNFLNKKTKDTNTSNLNLIAWLINFEPRPHFLYYVKDERNDTSQSIAKQLTITPANSKIEKLYASIHPNKSSTSHYHVILMLILVCVLAVCYHTSMYFLRKNYYTSPIHMTSSKQWIVPYLIAPGGKLTQDSLQKNTIFIIYKPKNLILQSKIDSSCDQLRSLLGHCKLIDSTKADDKSY